MDEKKVPTFDGKTFPQIWERANKTKKQIIITGASPSGATVYPTAAWPASSMRADVLRRDYKRISPK